MTASHPTPDIQLELVKRTANDPKRSPASGARVRISRTDILLMSVSVGAYFEYRIRLGRRRIQLATRCDYQEHLRRFGNSRLGKEGGF